MDKTEFKQKLQVKIPARWHMSLIFLTTIACGILISKFILFFNLAEPMIRYGIAVLFSYAVFFVLIYFWLRIHFGYRRETSSQDVLDAVDAVDALDDLKAIDFGASGEVTKAAWRGQGGQFSGGGASFSWDTGQDGVLSVSKKPAELKDIVDFGDFDEGIVMFLIVVVLTAIFGSAGYIIYQAPEILFEAAFEVFLAAGLFRSAKKMQAEGWKYSVFKRTWWLFALILCSSMLFGFFIKKQCPEASSFAHYRELCWQ